MSGRIGGIYNGFYLPKHAVPCYICIGHQAANSGFAGERENGFEQDDTQSGFSDCNSNSISVCFFQIINFAMGSFFVCLILPIGFIMMTAGLHYECESDHKVTANIGMVFAMVYCMFIMLVYFAQLTTVNNEQLTEQAAKLIEFNKFGLIFNYDLLGYGIMALSTFFTGLSMKAKNQTDRWLKALMIIHGVFFFSCTFLPMTGMFSKMSSEGNNIGGRLALVAWCIYFLPVGFLSLLHFRKR